MRLYIYSEANMQIYLTVLMLHSSELWMNSDYNLIKERFRYCLNLDPAHSALFSCYDEFVCLIYTSGQKNSLAHNLSFSLQSVEHSHGQLN